MTLAFKKCNLSAFRNFLDAKYGMLTAASEFKTQPYCLVIDPPDICQNVIGRLHSILLAEHASFDVLHAMLDNSRRLALNALLAPDPVEHA